MNATPSATNAAPRWHGPGADRIPIRERMRKITWRWMLWSYLYPPRGQRIMPTISGVLMIAVSLGIGSAAYNTSNNILFITLSLLLACLIGSGVMSALNLAKVSWRVTSSPPYRVGQTGAVSIELRNAKRLLPTYGLWFDLRTKADPEGHRLVQRQRLDPEGEPVQLDWAWTPTQRGHEVIELAGVGSLFPFGFLKKVLACELRTEVLVWPAAVEYQNLGVIAPSRRQSGHTVSKLGQNGDLLALRKYASGDSHRLIHWKASARLRQLMVRQFSSEQQEGYSIRVDTSADLWPRPEQFELLCSFVATLASDLFASGRLGTVAIDLDPPAPVRSVRDLEAFFDRLAQLEPRPSTGRPSQAPFASASTSVASGSGAAGGGPLTLSFSPDGARGVAAFVNGQKAATA
ncbi:DUF58 domain-containing protein [Actomonas aquatica]|uniref:DUF58 domain-containing protein n=1 Tax=Actomonas aquatica TaxID=2866162 RepID=A0ABZ1C7K9_9BACT|nr:DUF58 domain-containing protein [Opitutus sp. WL0086]WRQ87392.1 DUF58 domain-containing protein [Opitutus sp. WL0086]